jgi:hypothetical protein
MEAEPTATPDAGAAEQQDDAAWAEVEARWQEEEVHKAFLARHADLPRLAEAGRRYREALERRPGDPVAQRWRDEVLKRATVLAMAQLPRTAPPRQVSPGLRRALLLAVVLAMAAATAWVVSRFPRAG